MINGTYRIVMKTLMGKKYGRLTLYETENGLSGNMDILGHRNELCGGTLTDGKCRFSGKFVTPLRNISFTAEGNVDEKQVNLLIRTEKFTMPVFGESEIETETDERG